MFLGMSYLASCVLCSVLCVGFRVCVVLGCVVFCCASRGACCVLCCRVLVLPTPAVCRVLYSVASGWLRVCSARNKDYEVKWDR